MVGSLYGGIALVDTVAMFERTGDPAVFDRHEQPPYRGLQAIDNPVYWKLFTSSVSEVRAVRDNLISPAEAAQNIYDHLAESRLCPDPWGLLDRADRSPAVHSTLAMYPVLRLVLWGRFRAPAFIRRHYFRHARAVLGMVGSDLSRSCKDEIRRAAAGPWGYFRDALISQNRDQRRW